MNSIHFKVITTILHESIEVSNSPMDLPQPPRAAPLLKPKFAVFSNDLLGYILNWVSVYWGPNPSKGTIGYHEILMFLLEHTEVICIILVIKNKQ